MTQLRTFCQIQENSRKWGKCSTTSWALNMCLWMENAPRSQLRMQLIKILTWFYFKQKMITWLAPISSPQIMLSRSSKFIRTQSTSGPIFSAWITSRISPLILQVSVTRSYLRATTFSWVISRSGRRKGSAAMMSMISGNLTNGNLMLTLRS
jgi:hypothetical protein